MKEFNIYDANTQSAHTPVATIRATNGKLALLSFVQRNRMTVSLYTVRRIKPNTWEMSNPYGSYFYCCEKI